MNRIDLSYTLLLLSTIDNVLYLSALNVVAPIYYRKKCLPFHPTSFIDVYWRVFHDAGLTHFNYFPCRLLMIVSLRLGIGALTTMDICVVDILLKEA